MHTVEEPRVDGGLPRGLGLGLEAITQHAQLADGEEVVTLLSQLAGDTERGRRLGATPPKQKKNR